MRCGRIIALWSYIWIVFLIVVAAILVFMDRSSWDHDRRKHLQELDRREIEKELELPRQQEVAFDEVYQKKEIVPFVYKRQVQKVHKEAMKCKEEYERAVKLHGVWSKANEVITRHGLYKDSPDVATILNALATAKIVNVDRLNNAGNLGYEDKGTAEKWLVTLEGGQKAVMKLDWEPENFGKMKDNGMCNYHYELPAAEIAAFHLHKVLGFRNSVYVSGRLIDLKREIIPAASQDVMKQIREFKNSVCITGQFVIPKKRTSEICPIGGLVKASLSYWIPRRLKLYTSPPRYMPFSTPTMELWGVGLNNRTYCEQVRKEVNPYHRDWYYHELFDFAVLDSLMFHYDSKHYVVYDESSARGLTVRLDHGRAFCSHTADNEDVMLAPIRQCCTLRSRTYQALLSTGKLLAASWKASMATDPLAPVMDLDTWMPVIERRRNNIIKLVHQCAEVMGGLEKVLVE